jgi:hypothetical protein
VARIVVYDACVLHSAPLRDLWIVTFNLSDVPASILGDFGIVAIHPDEFIARLWDEHQAGVLAAAKLHRASLKRPSKTVAESLATLEQCRLTATVARFRTHAESLATVEQCRLTATVARFRTHADEIERLLTPGLAQGSCPRTSTLSGRRR